jgi:hypothetical protein
MIRRFRRDKLEYWKDHLNWRRKYRVYNEYATSLDKRYQVTNFDKKRWKKEREKQGNIESFNEGPDFLVGGGLAIQKDPLDPEITADHDIGDLIVEGFYTDLDIEFFPDYNIDDIAGFAMGDIDII